MRLRQTTVTMAMRTDSSAVTAPASGQQDGQPEMHQP
jgi:hypothetical protein